MADESIATAPEAAKPGYWAVLPSNVRYDDRLRPNEKILYAEITALASKDGYCWADNRYFAELYGMAEHSIQTFIRDLEKHGYITVEVVQKGNQRQPERRRIWIDSGAFDRFRSVLNKTEQGENEGAPSQKIRAPSQKIQTTLNNNKNNNNTCSEHVSGSDFKRERFDGFWAFYKSVTPKGVSVGGKSRAMASWNKIKPDDETIAIMGRALKTQSASPDWQRGIGIPNASTWLNQRRWEDLPEFGEASEEAPQERSVQQW